MSKIKVERLVKVHDGERGKRETDTQAFFEWELESFNLKELMIHTETGNYRISFKDMVKILFDLLGKMYGIAMNMD